MRKAISNDRPYYAIRQKNSPRVVGSSGLGWVDPEFFLGAIGARIADFLSDDWEVREPKK